MTMNLMIERAAPRDAAADWSAICAAGAHGIVNLPDELVNEIARLLDGAPLSNGESVSAYAYDDEFYAAMVCSFGPSLLAPETLESLREILAGHDRAEALLDVVLERGLQISFSGKDFIDARIKGVNWPADEVEINRCAGNMKHMIQDLVPYAVFGEHGEGELSFQEFETAVSERGWLTDMPERLDAFVAYGRRNDAVKVYWA